jgi:hypothetical protein
MVTLPSLAEGERLGIIEGEIGEALAYIGKIRRHGYESRHPDQSHPDSQRTNRQALEEELAHVVVGIALAVEAEDFNPERFVQAIRDKAATLNRWTHNQTIEFVRLKNPEHYSRWLDIWRDQV